MSKLTLNALFDYVNNDGIFTYLNSFDVPWKEDVDVDVLDLDYHSKYGTRVVSKTVTSLLTTDGLSAANKAKLAKLIYHKNKVKWDELWNSMGLYDEFNPLDNTNWTESETIQHSGQDAKTQNIGAKQNSYTKGQQANTSQTGAQTFTEGSHTDTIGSQSNTTGAQTIGTEEKRSAYNSSNYQPNVKKDESIGQRSDTIGQRSDIFGSKENSQSARSDSFTEGQRSDTSTEGAQQNSESGTNSYTDTHTITRSGNIGVTTSGELIRDFRKTVNWQFFEYVYEDINDALVIEVYGREDDDFDDYTIVTAYQLPIASASKLGGIKVGQNLTIAADGTLNAQAEAGDVQSVNGKTGIVVLVPSDIGAAAATDLTTLAGTVESQGQAINNIRQVPANGSTGQAVRKTSDGYDWGNIREVPDGGNLNEVLQRTASGYMWAGILQVPSDGTQGQVLTKGSDNNYSWQDASGGGGYKVFRAYTVENNNGSNQSVGVKMDANSLKVYCVKCTDAPNIVEMFIDEDMNNTHFNLNALNTYSRWVWDGKIVFVIGQASSGGATVANYNEILIETSSNTYQNDVTSYKLAYKDEANAEWTQAIAAYVNHIALGGCQYYSYSGHEPKIYYTDVYDVEHELTNLDAHVSGRENTYFCVGKDLENVYVKSIRVVSADGYRCQYTLGYY